MLKFLPLILLAGCQTIPAVNCANADKARAAAVLAMRALDRVCPADFGGAQ